MEKSARLYHCARCHQQVVICSHCDRGNIYCGSICSQLARIQNHRIANQRYQKSFKGKLHHAQRQRAFRQRQQQKVTDHGYTDLPLHALLQNAPDECEVKPKETTCCHFCGEFVSAFLRNGYLGHYRGPV